MIDADHEQLKTSARSLVTLRTRRAQSRGHVRGVLDAMAAEARRFLGEVFTANDPVTGYPVALVVRSDERLPDDYAMQTPRPATDTASRLIVDVLGHSLTIEMSDAGKVQARGEVRDVALDEVVDVRVADASSEARTYLVTGADSKNRSEVPFVRALARLVDAAAQDEAQFLPAAQPGAVAAT